MPERMTTYDKIKELLDANLAVLTTHIATNRDIMNVKLDELKQDTEEIKQHAKDTNGHVAENFNRIIEIEKHVEHGLRLYGARWYHIAVVVLSAIILSGIADAIGIYEIIKTIFLHG